MAYQSAKAGISAHAGQLLINDLANGGMITEHVISLEKGQIINNTNHYRDMKKRVEALETAIEQCWRRLRIDHLEGVCTDRILTR